MDINYELYKVFYYVAKNKSITKITYKFFLFLCFINVIVLINNIPTSKIAKIIEILTTMSKKNPSGNIRIIRSVSGSKSHKSLSKKIS